jgi:hypothetical protein
MGERSPAMPSVSSLMTSKPTACGTRCHKDDHHRAKCKLPAAKWEEKFDREKVKYWESVLKWQGKAADDHKSRSSSTNPKPTLIPKKENRRAEITLEFSSEDDEDAPLQFRMLYFPDSESAEDDRATRNIVYSDSGDDADEVMQGPEPELPTPVPIPPHDLSSSGQSWRHPRRCPGRQEIRTRFRLAHAQLRGPRLTTILFGDGRSSVLATADVDAFTRYNRAVDPAFCSHSHEPPPPPPPLASRAPSPLLSPAPSPAFTWKPSRPPTPSHEPASPPAPGLSPSPHHDVTYHHDYPPARPLNLVSPSPAIRSDVQQLPRAVANLSMGTRGG